MSKLSPKQVKTGGKKSTDMNAKDKPCSARVTVVSNKGQKTP